MKKYFSRVRCKGMEKRLEDCEWEDHEMSIQCTSSQSVAGVICASCKSRAFLPVSCTRFYSKLHKSESCLCKEHRIYPLNILSIKLYSHDN